MDNSLKKIISEGWISLSKAFNSNKSNTEVVGIDIGSSSIKAVQLKKKGNKAILQTYGVISLGPYGNLNVGSITNLKTEDLARALVDLIKEANITTKSAVVSIPSLSSLIFTLSLPSKIEPNQLSKIIPIEARKYIPVPISEVTLDWFIVPSELESFESNETSKKDIAQANTEVLVVAIHNDILFQYKDLFKKIELESNSFEMEIFSGIRSSLNNETAPILLIDFGASKTKVFIIESGVVRIFHVVNRGSQDITRNISQALSIDFIEAEKLKKSVGLDSMADVNVEKIVRLSINYIFTDINSIVFAYEKKYNKNVSKVLLFGGGSLLKGLLEYSKENFKIEVFYSNPFSKTEMPAFLEPVLKISGPEFSVAVGLALSKLL